jgi:hypothetical protein
MLTARADDDHDNSAKIVVKLLPQAQLPFSRQLPYATPPAGGDRLAKSIAAAASKSVAEQGIENATTVLRDCQKEEGGVMGLSNIPSGRASSRIDHCFRQ